MARRKRSGRGTAPKPDRGRSKMLARVHIAKKALGLDEDTYRAMLLNSFGVDSSGKLKPELLAQLMRSLEREVRRVHRRDSPPRSRGGAGGGVYPGRPHNINDPVRGPLIEKIEALLAEAKRPWSYADVLARKIAKVERVAFATPDGLHKIVAALVKDAQRHGRPTNPPRTTARDTAP